MSGDTPHYPTSAPKRRPAIDPKRAFTTLFHSNSRNTTAVLSSGSPWTEESRVKTASLFHAHIASLFLEWKSADISVLHLLCVYVPVHAKVPPRGGATCYRHPTCSRELSSA